MSCLKNLLFAASVAAIAGVQTIGLAQESELDRLSKSADDPFPQLTIDEDREPVSVTVRALNKITARYVDIEASMEEIASFGTLEIVPRFCDKRPPEEFPETTAFLQIYDLGRSNGETETVETENMEEVAVVDPAATTNPGLETPRPGLFEVDKLGDLSEGEKLFSGWMFASSPALNPLEHPVYDIWVVDCKTVAAER